MTKKKIFAGVVMLAIMVFGLKLGDYLYLRVEDYHKFAALVAPNVMCWVLTFGVADIFDQLGFFDEKKEEKKNGRRSKNNNGRRSSASDRERVHRRGSGRVA